jgi:hypothetical protein
MMSAIDALLCPALSGMFVFANEIALKSRASSMFNGCPYVNDIESYRLENNPLQSRTLDIVALQLGSRTATRLCDTLPGHRRLSSAVASALTDTGCAA